MALGVYLVGNTYQTTYFCFLAVYMKQLKTLCLAAIICAVAPNVQAQAKKRFKGKPIEFGLSVGASNYMGDLTPSIALGESHLAGGLLCRFNYSDFITLRGNATFGQISGDDKNYSSDPFRKQRNLNFKSNIMEFSGVVEWNILGFGETTRERPFSPFLYAGLGVFKFNPMTQFHYMPNVTDATGKSIHDAQLQQFDGKWIELQPLGTEGQETTKYNERRRYSLTQVCVPLGFGFKKQVDEFWAVGFDMGARVTFTDYMDDVSLTYVEDQIVGGNNGLLAAALADRGPELGYERFYNGDPRGTSKANDMYLFMNFTVTRKIVGGKTVCFQF